MWSFIGGDNHDDFRDIYENQRIQLQNLVWIDLLLFCLMVHAFSLPYCFLPLNVFDESVFSLVQHNEILLESLVCFVFSLLFLWFLIVCSLCALMFFLPFLSSLSWILFFFSYFLIFLFPLLIFKLCLPCYSVITLFPAVSEFPLLREIMAPFCRQPFISCTQKRNFAFCTILKLPFYHCGTAAVILC